MSNADHAILCLLWSETDDDGTPFDSLDLEVSDQLEALVGADWECFRENAERLGFDADEHCAMMLHPDCDGDAWNAAAHDFILTRNGHGTGFWDSGRWQSPWGEKLTELCKIYPELHCYVGDDGLIYAEAI
jgi:hypothetical protein